MKKLQFDYFMQIKYSEIVEKCHFTIKCFPKDTNRQAVKRLNAELFPDVTYNKGEDSFGNRQIYGEDLILHDTFHFRINGEVMTGLSSFEEEERGNMTSVFRHPYGLNRSGEKLREYYDGLGKEDFPDFYQRGIFLMHRLHQDFIYEKGCTDMKTTAEEAWGLGRGVCQDYAHILIALLHMYGIPARYVTGMLVGEGASHAWVEVLQDGKWYGLDPTNDVTVGEDYIRIGCGRDASDCLINRGIMRGGGGQEQIVQVRVSEVGGE